MSLGSSKFGSRNLSIIFCTLSLSLSGTGISGVQGTRTGTLTAYSQHFKRSWPPLKLSEDVVFDLGVYTVDMMCCNLGGEPPEWTIAKNKITA